MSALTESEIAYLHFVNDDQETLELATWSTNTKNYCQAAYDQHYPISQAGIWADSFRFRKPVVHNDYANETHKKGVPEGHFPLIRHAGVPVIADNKVVALIGVGNKASTYTDEDTALLQMFANELWQLTSLRRTQQKLTHQYQQLDELVNASGEGIIGIDTDGKITFANQAALNLLGYTHADELIGASAHQTFHHHKPNGDPYPDSECPNYLTITRQQVNEIHDDLFFRKDGSSFCVSNHSYPIFDQQQRCTGAVIMFNDITATKTQQDQLYLADAFFLNANEGMIITDANQKIERINPKVTEITGYAEHELLGQTPKLFSSGNHNADFYQAMWQTLQQTGRWQGEIWNKRKSGQIYPEFLSLSALKHTDGSIAHYLGIFVDMSLFKAQDRALYFLAHHDNLTQLPNRTALYSSFSDLQKTTQRDNRQLAVLFVDLDRFKYINDSLGHHVGDELLIQVAERLKNNVRASDILSRWGGDEFVILLPGIQNLQQAQGVASKIINSLTMPFFILQHELNISCSIGISVYPTDSEDFNDLLKHADSAMYKAKSAGRNQFCVFQPGMFAEINERMHYETLLRSALERQELALYFQPQLNLQGQLSGVEVLLRWFSPKLGEVPPSQFIPIAEELGLINKIGEWVLEQAIQQLSHWQKDYKNIPTLSVNIAVSQLNQPHFISKLEGYLHRFQVNGQQLMLEVNESQLTKQGYLLTNKLQQLAQLGVCLSVDDFGTGFSNLAQLKNLDVAQLKIDNLLIEKMHSNEKGKVIVDAAIYMAQRLGMEVVAEGVETADQVAALRTLNCDLMQGYYFAKPMSADEFTHYLRNLTQ